MISRLEDMPGWAKSSITSCSISENSSPPHAEDIEQGSTVRTPSIWNKEAFLSSIEQLKTDIGAIQEATAEIKVINTKSQAALTTEAERDLSEELREVIHATNKKGLMIKSLLAELKKENSELRKHPVAADGSSELRLRSSLLAATTRKFIDEMTDYQAAQQKYKTDLQNKAKRQVKVVKPDATDEEVEHIMTSPGGRDEFYRALVLAGGVNDEIMTVSAKIAGKFSDIKELERSVAELHHMFLDLALLVEQQGSLLNNIEHNVRQASDHVEEGTKEIVESLYLQKSIRKKQLFILLVVITCTIVVLFALRILPPR